MGEWNSYSNEYQQMEIINTVHLSNTGNILAYIKFILPKKIQRKTASDLKKLRPGLYDLLI